MSLGRRSPFSARSVGREGDNCPSHTPSQLEALGAGHPPCRGGTGLPTACPKKLDPGQGRLGRAKLTVGGRAELAPCHSEDRPGSGPSMVSIAGGRTVPCCSGPKVAALTVGTVLLLVRVDRPLHFYPPLPLAAPSLPALTSAFSAVTVLLRSDQEPLYPGE